MYKLYGIANCDTVKKARTFLDSRKIEFEFIDFKKYQPTEKDLLSWSKEFGGWPVNRSGLTYKKVKDNYEPLPEKDKIKFIQENTSMIKRPILVKGNAVLAFGFNEQMYSDIL